MILHINTSREWRGGEQQLYYLVQGLTTFKIPQMIVGQPGSPLETKCKENGYEFVPIEMRGEWDRKAYKNIRSLCISKNVKLIHTHTAHAHTLALLAKRNHLNIPLIVSRRVDFKPKSSFFSRWKYQHPANDYYLPVSQKIKEVMMESKIAPERIITVYSGIDLKRFSKSVPHEYLKEEFHIPKKCIVIGNVAALVDHKDQETLLNAIAKMRTGADFRLMIVGDGKLENKLKTQAEQLGITEKVIFTGYRKDIPALLSLFNIFTLTSKEEGLGTSVLDAMASGLPIVATNGGGIGEMLDHNEGAYVCSVGDAENIALGLDKLVGSEELRTKFGIFNKTSVKRFSVTKTVEKTKLIYYSFLGDTLYGEGT